MSNFPLFLLCIDKEEENFNGGYEHKSTDLPLFGFVVLSIDFVVWW